MKLARLNNAPEIFYSIQGEGKTTGRPSVFIRSSLCNLHCIWCDTDYTWNWEGSKFKHVNDRLPGYSKFRKEEQIIESSIQEIIAIVDNYPSRNFVLTGGEPLLQDADWTELMQSLKKESGTCWFEVETNGTLLPSAGFDALVDQYNVSPKLSNSKNPAQLRIRKKVLAFYARSPKATFKFVLSSPKDQKEVLSLISLYSINPETVWLMPEGTTEFSLEERQTWVAKLCMDYGFHYSDRLHVRLFGSKRGT